MLEKLKKKSTEIVLEKVINNTTNILCCYLTLSHKLELIFWFYISNANKENVENICKGVSLLYATKNYENKHKKIIIFCSKFYRKLKLKSLVKIPLKSIQTYTTIILTITARPTFIRYSAYNVLVSDNFYLLDFHKLRTCNLS